MKGFTHFSQTPVHSSKKRHCYCCVPQDTYTHTHTYRGQIRTGTTPKEGSSSNSWSVSHSSSFFPFLSSLNIDYNRPLLLRCLSLLWVDCVLISISVSYSSTTLTLHLARESPATDALPTIPLLHASSFFPCLQTSSPSTHHPTSPPPKKKELILFINSLFVSGGFISRCTLLVSLIENPSSCCYPPSVSLPLPSLA